MSKVFVVLDDRDQVLLQSICMDKDPQEALQFVMKRIAPKVKKQVPCLDGKLLRPER